MSNILSQEVIQSDSQETIESETLRILEASENIKLKIQSETIRKEYEEVRLATIGALRELRLSTSSDLQIFKSELTNPSDTLSNGTISTEELEIIQKEFQDLEQQALQEQKQQLQEEVLAPLREMYGESPEVMVFLENQFSAETILSEAEFGLQLTQIIGRFNRSHDDIYLLPPRDTDLSDLYTGVSQVHDFSESIDTVVLTQRFQELSAKSGEVSAQIQDYRREIRDGVTEERQKEIDEHMLALGYVQMALSQDLAETADGVTGLDATSTTGEAKELEEQAKQEAEQKLLEAQAFIKESFESLANPDGLSSEYISTLFLSLSAQTAEIPELAQNVSDFVLQALEDIKNSESILSKNFANLPLPRNTESDEYKIVFAAKVQEYNTDLQQNIENNPELTQAKEDFLGILRNEAQGKLSEDELNTIFESVIQSIRDNPSGIGSLEELRQVFGREIENPLIVQALETARIQGLAYVEIENSKKIVDTKIVMEEICADGIVSPDEYEKFEIVKAVYLELSENRDELQASILTSDETLPLIIAYLEGGSIEDFNSSMQALEVQNTIIPEEGEEEIISPQSVELSNEQQAQNTISALEAALENNNPEAIQIALEAVQKESEEAEIEAKTDGQMAVIQTGSDIPGNEIVIEKAVVGLEATARSTGAGENTYIQERLTQLRDTLGEDNPLVVRITSAQEEGIQKAYAKQSGQEGTVTQLPASARNFYSETIISLGLSESEVSTLTPTELKILKSSETARESFMNFRQTLENLNLESIWQFRNQVFRAIGSLDFSIGDGDYIGANEMNIFLSKVLYATTGKDTYKNIPTNFQEIQSKIITENRLGIFSGVRDVSGVGDGGGVIENKFRQLFAPKDAGILTFNTVAFQEALSGKNMNS